MSYPVLALNEEVYNILSDHVEILIQEFMYLYEKKKLKTCLDKT